MLKALSGPVLSKASIDCASNGENIIVAAIALKSVLVYRIFFVASTATTVTFIDGTGGTAFTGAVTLTAGGSFVLDLDEEPWFDTTRGNAFIISQTGTAQLSGRIYYVQR